MTISRKSLGILAGIMVFIAVAAYATVYTGQYFVATEAIGGSPSTAYSELFMNALDFTSDADTIGMNLGADSIQIGQGADIIRLGAGSDNLEFGGTAHEDDVTETIKFDYENNNKIVWTESNKSTLVQTQGDFIIKLAN